MSDQPDQPATPEATPTPAGDMRAYLAAIGRKGGKVTSPKKRAAIVKNLAKARVRQLEAIRRDRERREAEKEERRQAGIDAKKPPFLKGEDGRVRDEWGRYRPSK